MRLDKCLTDLGLGTRSQVKLLLKRGEIAVNGRTEKSAKFQLDPEKTEISYQGQVYHYESFLYYLLNKPKGVVSATEDKVHKTVLELLDQQARHRQVFPVGRLDKDTHGLLLLTNDGQLAHQLLSPKKHVAKVYRALVSGIMTPADQEHFRSGIRLKDHHCLPARLSILATDQAKQQSSVEIVIQEGKFHQVKRMVQACGKEVLDLQRTQMGPLKLDPALALGEYRRLTPHELAQLKNTL
ncbi:pseudouridine synthase [Streptococcus halichoeri]|uniref:pseudouridine synthase n=1 Tax=Streptococcus halichoeri TaxID=254785 RepID=UPI001358D991|nr:pseudouridine synthase [Streptococcus halichoeri]